VALGPEILTVAEMAAADQAAIAAGTPGRELMERAGAALAEETGRRWPDGPIAVLCGPGNNGGDGFVAARKLVEAGREVRLALLGDREALTGDAAMAAADWSGPVERLAPESAAGAAVVIDALFGAGLTRPVDGAPREALRNAERGAPIVSVDLPSGLAGDTGTTLGFAPQATLTVTFHRKKPAHVLEPGGVSAARSWWPTSA
jgi:NAD(P)H-hydrate epimerase